MIARATLADLAALGELEAACFAPVWSEKALRDLLQNPAYLVLLQRDATQAPLAYLIGWQVGEDAELARLGVAPGARGQGLGAAILQLALEIWHAAGAHQVFLEVRHSNTAARRLYAANHFVEVGKRLNYYADGESGLVLRLEIAEKSIPQ